MFIADSKAQGALEYLLILAGAVLIAAIVLTLLAGTGQGEEPKLAFSRAEAKCGSLNEDRCGNSDFIQYNDFCSGSGVAGDSCDLKKGGDGEVDCQWLENRCIPGRDFYSLKGGSGGDNSINYSIITFKIPDAISPVPVMAELACSCTGGGCPQNPISPANDI